MTLIFHSCFSLWLFQIDGNSDGFVVLLGQRVEYVPQTINHHLYSLCQHLCFSCALSLLFPFHFFLTSVCVCVRNSVGYRLSFVDVNDRWRWLLFRVLSHEKRRGNHFVFFCSLPIDLFWWSFDWPWYEIERKNTRKCSAIDCIILFDNRRIRWSTMLSLWDMLVMNGLDVYCQSDTISHSFGGEERIMCCYWADFFESSYPRIGVPSIEEWEEWRHWWHVNDAIDRKREMSSMEHNRIERWSNWSITAVVFISGRHWQHNTLT